MTQQYFKHIAIELDSKEKKTNKCFFTKLIDSLSSKLKREKHPITKKLRVLLEQEDFEYENVIQFGSTASTNKYFLMRDFDELVKLLQKFCEEPKEKEYEIEITIEVPKRKKFKKVDVYEKITILERWVKIGYKMYRRQFDPWTGDEFIIVDGDTYNIKHDRYGKEFLA